MDKKIIIGIDNGVSGSWGVVGDKEMFLTVPSKKVLKYTKKKQSITRIDFPECMDLLQKITKGYNLEEVLAVLERPMVNPSRFVSSTSALRSWEAILILMESIGIPYTYIDSKEWQKKMLPVGVLGSEELKKASLKIGNKLYPQFANHKHKDRDGLLIASYWANFRLDSK